MKGKLNRQKDIRRKIKNKIKRRKFKNQMSDVKDILKELLSRPFIKQRTPEWFKLREDRLTASDLHDAVKNPLSLAKRKLKGITYNSNAIPALKWGTMFEPIATEIYEDLKKKKVYEFGLVINEDIKNFGASPDGITEDGCMIEIKCPYKRKIENGVIPEKYQYQIQGQLAVCKLKDCDYIECEFVSFDTKEEFEANISKDDYYGMIAELRMDNGEMIYKYSKLKDTQMKELPNGYKFIYWKLKLINIQEVKFDEERWKREIEPKIQDFHYIYMNEKKNNHPKNLFIDED
jgi:putative phage-type endonuclease